VDTPGKTSSAAGTKSSYPSHKTVSLVEEKAIANTDPAPVKEIKTSTTSATVKTTYPAHKTVSLTTEQPVVNKEIVTEKKEETPRVVQANTTVDKPVNVVNADAKGYYPPNKTVNLSAEETAVRKDAVSGPKEETPQLQTETIVSKPVTAVDPSVNTYSTHKTVELTDENPAAQSNETQITDKPATTIISANADGSYPAHKTVSLAQGTVQPPLLANEQQRENPKNEERVAIVNTTSDTAQTDSSKTNSNGSYPAHKTYYFVKEEAPVIEKQTVRTTETSVIAEKRENVAAENKASITKVAATTAPAAKAKKPVLWIAASSVFLLAAAGTAWYAYQQKKSLQEEITVLKQNNEALAESVKRLQKDLHFDDIITRAGKLDSKNNISVTEDAGASEVIRTCFSITPNAQAKRGTKIVYIRLVDANSHVLSSSKANTFEYKGEKIPYSVKEQINYKGAEMMLCVDFKPSEKLVKGAYKAEVYSEGVLDGTAAFELK
jgi:hypothetical protein